MGSKVSLVKARGTEKDIKRSVSRAVELVDFKRDNNIGSVVFKPNLCYYWDAYTGCTTDPRVVAGAVDFVRESWGSDLDIKIAEADATAMRTKYAFRILGYEKLAKEKNVELFNLSRDEAEERAVSVNGREIKFKVPRLLLESDLFVNVPKLKVMRETRITCAMKNMFGCISSPRKIVYHPFLNEAIVGINKILRPHITIVDGLIALGSFPARLDLIMASTDPFSVDWVASQIMGYDPDKIGFLRLAMREKLGMSDGISTCGENAAVFKERFPRKKPVFEKWSWKAQLGLLRLYHRITGDIVPPALEDM